jgi:hypothetical protein
VAILSEIFRRQKDRSLIPKINLRVRFILQFMDKFGIHSGAGACQFMQRGRKFNGSVGQHSGCGVRSFLSRLASFHNQHIRATLLQSNRNRQANDPAADYDDVPVLHLIIVEDSVQSQALPDFPHDFLG